MSRQGLEGIVAPRLPEPLLQPLSDSEVRVLRYLPTNLTTLEIAREFAKFGTHHRAETVELARALGLLAPSRTGRATR